MGTRRKSRKFWATLAALTFATTIGTVISTQGTASAATWSDCANYKNVLCMYDLQNPRGYLNAGAIARYDFNRWGTGRCINVPADFNDKAGSAFINVAPYRYATLYQNINCGGYKISLGYGHGPSSYNWLSDKSMTSSKSWNNQVTSIRMY